LDPAWIRWAVARRKLAGAADRIAASPDLFENLLARLEEVLASRDLGLSSAISGVINPDHFNLLTASAPRAAFKWCTRNIALANHHGDIFGAINWMKQSDPLLERTSQVDPEAVADHFNHRLVTHHNRYHFVPGIPPELNGPIEFLENQLAVKKQAGSQVDITLGRLYGTLGQNFAFCGEGHFESALEYFKKARSALGEYTVPDFKPEWMRQINYEAVAYLDAGRFEEARQRVCAYLEVSGLNAVRPEAIALEPPWKHNLLARFLADTLEAGLCRHYLSWAGESGFAPPGPNHPWQLWAFNVGRIAISLGESEAAAAAFKISLERCLRAKPTIRVMALLGLSGLVHMSALPENISEIESEVRRAADELSADHFTDVIQSPFINVLEKVWREPGRLFPFSYH
jgi:tetratricopeptide (TPR) repeat protein